MKSKLLILAMAAMSASMVAQAQTCDVTYTFDAEVTATGNDVTLAKAVVFGLPRQDVEDNSRKGMRVVDLASRLQDKGGDYAIEFTELRACDGKAPERYAPNSIRVEGVTLKGINQINRLSLKMTGEVQDRYDHRANRGDKHAWNHKHGRKTQRDDLGRKKD